jgi:hypothetical protein
MNRVLEFVPIVANIHNSLRGWHNLMLKGFLLFADVADKSSSYSKSSISLAVEILQALHCIASKTLFCPSHGYTFCINLWEGTSLP